MSKQHIKQPPHSAGRKLIGLRSAIDPSQIPSAPDVAYDDQVVCSAQPFLTCDSQRPIPLANTDYIAIDQGQLQPSLGIRNSRTMTRASNI
jgi:protein transport protein SEC24